MRGCRATVPASERVDDRFQRLWKSFQTIWKAMNVLPVPVASVSRMRLRPSAMASITRLTATSW